MGIGTISDYGSLLQNYRMPSISTVSVEEAAVQESSHTPDTPALEREVEPAVKQPAAQVKLEDVSLSLKGNEPFEMTGRDSAIEQLDIQKAISDMKKDSILEQYQFFVGSSQNILQNDIEPDGVVITKL